MSEPTLDLPHEVTITLNPGVITVEGKLYTQHDLDQLLAGLIALKAFIEYEETT